MNLFYYKIIFYTLYILIFSIMIFLKGAIFYTLLQGTLILYHLERF